MWKVIKWFIGVTILLSIVIGIVQSVAENRSLNELKLSDPDQYLQVIKEKDETRWLLALKDLKPEQYQTEYQHNLSLIHI